MSNDNTLVKLKSTADILGGAVFFATDTGTDPEYPLHNDLLPNGMYIRLEGSDNSVAYISAYELDKALGIIGQMSVSKASQSDVDVIQQAIADAATKSELQLLESEVAGKASKTELDDILDSFAGKADQSVIDEVIAQLATKASQSDVDALTEAVSTKAEEETVEALQHDVEALQEVLELIKCEETLTSISSQIALLNNKINSKLEASDLSTINNTINDLSGVDNLLSERLDIVETNLSKKATTTYVQGQVSELNTAITGIAAGLTTKADKETVGRKADKETVDGLSSKVSTINTKLSNIETAIDDRCDNLSAEIAKKINSTEVARELSDINTALADTIDVDTFNSETARINTKLRKIETDYEDDISKLYTMIEDVNSSTRISISELSAINNTTTKSINDHKKTLDSLVKTTDNQTKQLKQNWVRVMSSREYKNLLPYKDEYKDQEYSDKRKYPNIVYMVVDYNKPKAIYIGDILIAKAEAGGSIGFAYTFPISF